MNIRIAALALMLVASMSFAQKYQQSPGKGAAERATMIKSLQRGKEIKGSIDRYQVLPEVQAIQQGASAETPERALALIGASGAQLVETKGKLVLYRSAQQRPAVVEGRGGSGVYPTVLNLRTEALGVLTGTLIVKPKNMADADAIAGSHGLQKSKVYSQLQTVFYKANPGVDLADVSAALQADPRVESAYPEIVEHVRVPK